MPTITTCPSCSGPLRVPDELVGQRVRCPTCQTIFDAAAAPAPSPPPAPAPGRPPWNNVRLELDGGDPAPEPPPARQPANPPRLKGAVEIGSPADDEAPSPPPAPRRPAPPPRPEPRGRPADDDEDHPRRGPYDRGPRRLDAEPHRGALVLVLGIVGLAFIMFSMCYGLGTLVGLPLGVTAWILGTIDLRKIRNQEMDEDGLGITQAGWICGIIGTILHSLVLLTCGVFIAVVLISASAAPGGPMGPKPQFGAPPPVMRP